MLANETDRRVHTVMPRIQIYDAMNTHYAIDSMDWETIERWIKEWVPRLRSGDIALRMTLWPLFAPEGRGREAADWVTDSRVLGEYFNVSNDPETVMSQIHLKRRELQDQINEFPRRLADAEPDARRAADQDTGKGK